MLRRLRELLQRQQPAWQYRPNELRMDVVRAERLRREALQRESLGGSATPGLEERQARREPPITTADSPPRRTNAIAGLRSRAGLRQAMVLKEILEPPLALRGTHRGERRS